MTKQTASKLIKSLMPVMPDFKAAGRLLYQPVKDGMLVGCHFDSSDFEREVVLINYFATIVSYPHDFLGFDLSFRVHDKRGGDRWSLADEVERSEIADAIKRQALPLLKVMQSPEAFAKEMHQIDTLQGQRAAAVAFAKAGDKKMARDTIQKLLPKLNLSISWQSEIAARLTELLNELEKNSGASLLADWEVIGRAKLKVS